MHTDRGTNADVGRSRDFRFSVGLVAGTVIGAGLALWLAPVVAAGLHRGTTRWVRQLNRSAGAKARVATHPPARRAPQAL
jgi:hypothetical protein